MAAAVTSLILSPLASQGSGAASSAAVVDGVRQSAGHHETVGERQGRQAAPERCPDARRALRFYRARMAASLRAMDAPVPRLSRPPDRGACAYVRWLVERAKVRAHAARVALERWRREYAWWLWLPDVWQRLGACETGYGRKPGNWHWDSGTYVSAFGIYRPAYEAYHRWTGQNSPREQFEVAAAIQRRFGWGSWGCGGA